MPTEQPNSLSQHDKLHNHLNNQTIHNQNLKKQILELQSNKQKLHSEADALQSHLQTSSDSYLIPSDEESKLSENISQLVELFRQLEEESSKTADLEEQFRLESESVVGLETRLQALQSTDLSVLSTNCSRMIEQFRSLQEAAHATQASLRGLLYPVEDPHHSLTLQSEIDHLCTIYQNIINLLPALEKSIRSLHHTLHEETNMFIHEREQLQGHLDSLRQWIETHPAPTTPTTTNEIHHYRTSVLSEIAHLHQEIEQATQDGGTILTEEEQAALQKVIDALTERVTHHEEENHQMVQQLEEDMGDEQLHYQKLCRENKQLQSKLKSLRQGKKLQDKLQQLQEQAAQNRRTRQQIDSSQQELSSLRKKSSNLAKRREELEKQFNTHSVSKGRLASLRKEIAIAKQELADAEEDAPTHLEATRQLIQHTKDQIEAEEDALRARMEEYNQISDSEILEITDLSEQELAELRRKIESIHLSVRAREQDLEDIEEKERQVLIDKQSESFIRRKLRNRTRKTTKKKNARVKTAELSGSCVSLQPELALTPRFDRSESGEPLTEVNDLHTSSNGSWTTVENNGPSIRSIAPPSDTLIEIVAHKFCSLPVEDTPEPTSPDAVRPLPVSDPRDRQKAKKRRKPSVRPKSPSATLSLPQPPLPSMRWAIGALGLVCFIVAALLVIYFC